MNIKSNIKSSAIALLALVSLIPLAANANKKGTERGMIEKMEAEPCGARQRGFTGVGSLWASAGITAVNSSEKLCPQYVLKTDQLEYEIRPTDGKHPVVLPVGHEGQFRVKKDRIYLSVETGNDHRTRAYEVVGVKQTTGETAAAQDSYATKLPDPASTSTESDPSKDPSGVPSENKTPGTDQSDAAKTPAATNK